MTVAAPAERAALRRREGLDHRRRHQPDRRRARRTTAFDVAVIPHTLAVTTLGAKPAGRSRQPRSRRVAKYVERLLVRATPRRELTRCRSPTIENAIAAIERGEIVIVVDDADRENEGDLIMAAEKMTPEAMAFMIRHTSGVICMPVEGEPPRRAAPPADGRRQHRGAAHRVHGVGRRPPRHHHRHLGRRPCHHRARASSTPRPGPRTSPGPATSSRCGTARAACSSAPATPRPRSTSPGSPGCTPAGVLAEVVNDDGTMARLPRARGVRGRARPAADLDRRPDPLPPPPREAGAPGLRGPHPDAATATSPRTCSSRCSTATEHMAFVRGEVAGKENVLVRVHSECLTGDVFGSMRCDCGLQLDAAMETHRRRGRRAWSCTCAATRAAASASATRSARTRSRTRAATPSRPTSSSASPPTRASTASARRSSSTSASRRCGS